jgi:hypothetical protein
LDRVGPAGAGAAMAVEATSARLRKPKLTIVANKTNVWLVNGTKDWSEWNGLMLFLFREAPGI